MVCDESVRPLKWCTCPVGIGPHMWPMLMNAEKVLICRANLWMVPSVVTDILCL